MLPEPEALPRFSAVRIIVVSKTHERIVEPLVQGSRATRDGINEIIVTTSPTAEFFLDAGATNLD